MPQCKAITQKNIQCKNVSEPRHSLCSGHQNRIKKGGATLASVGQKIINTNRQSGEIKSGSQKYKERITYLLSAFNEQLAIDCIVMNSLIYDGDRHVDLQTGATVLSLELSKINSDCINIPNSPYNTNTRFVTSLNSIGYSLITCLNEGETVCNVSFRDDTLVVCFRGSASLHDLGIDMDLLYVDLEYKNPTREDACKPITDLTTCNTMSVINKSLSNETEKLYHEKCKWKANRLSRGGKCYDPTQQEPGMFYGFNKVKDVENVNTANVENIKVHQGFLRGYNLVRSKLIAVLLTEAPKYKKIVFTGHSLGSGYASLAALDYSMVVNQLHENIPVSGMLENASSIADITNTLLTKNNISVYNFGQPKFSNKGFLDYYKKLVPVSWSFINKEDIVSIKYRPDARAVGTLVYIGENGPDAPILLTGDNSIINNILSRTAVGSHFTRRYVWSIINGYYDIMQYTECGTNWFR